jgi:two-component system sensor histidine kinase RegB
MGLGFFIAKTLLERSGATVSLENRPAPATGAIARVSWPRAAFEGPETAGYGPAERPAELAGAGRG